ncbi:hypothetical protein [Micromonospora sp. RTGN7]|uniref:hypothetical protein n=1 Tax=Micromonospora sp. RTGN7 TaxID=3016526 RepID=UPI0029FF0D3A|nr:hypothetical protein [Micromonospora sp. RTGN7]
MRIVYGTDREALGYQLARPAGPELVAPIGDGAAAVRFLIAEPSRAGWMPSTACRTRSPPRESSRSRSRPFPGS